MKNICTNFDCEKYGRHQMKNRVKCIKCKSSLMKVTDKTWGLVYARTVKDLSQMNSDMETMGRLQLSIFDQETPEKLPDHEPRPKEEI